MAIDLSNKRIIMIHGLGSKPPAKEVHRLWSQCVIENIKLADPAVARRLEATPEALVHAYWANATPHHIPDDASYVRKLRRQVEKVIAARRKEGSGFHVGFGERAGAFFKDRGLTWSRSSPGR